MRLQIRDLGFQYPGRTLFQGLSYDFNPGSITWIRGPSGCGKSTFLKLVAGLIPRQQGQITWDDRDIQNSQHRVGYLHQDCHLIDHWTAFENLSLVSSEESKIHRWMKTFRIPPEVHPKEAKPAHGQQLVQSLSGGERQRISLIRVILQNPELALLDEPTAHLDDEQTDLALRCLQTELKGKTILIVSHDGRLSTYVDQVWNWHEVQK